MEKSGTQTPLSLAAAKAVRTYAATTRSALGSAEAPVISYAGLWLLLASLAPAAETETDEILGLNRADARAAALALLESPHPTIGAAVAGWLRPGVELTKALPIMLDPLPEQAGLDAWADEHTRGLITEFPLEIDPWTLLVFASALVVTPRWSEPLDDDGDGLLLLEGGFQAVVETEAAGPVAVACPPSEDGISVYSVIAANGVAADDVWRAAEEVVRRVDAGEVQNRTFDPGDAGTGHAWTVREVTAFGSAPADRWRSHLPEWSAEDRHDLAAAPGVAEIAGGVMAAIETDTEAVCVQKAVASYDREGFKAAAVTGMMVRAATGAPRETTVRQIDLRFDRPHAVVAVARGGAWEGIPLFDSWVTPA
ncbi:hypothetical protein [Nocardioides albus]|uniref:Serpin domain-containing protein n=1 Tax=Nocardioides albus TaxID=1841 RepID=A0A7W5FA56_9ACTN|nr:hypothetical protein [Nocardioides albus]MBB3090969.1 hypothetical protein [Nocardioides albus]GGU38694.1 hypothetical protein GCM10007979_42410 [Nocardioides albus]